MKRKRNLIVLLAVFAVVCSSIVAVKAVEKHVEQIQTVDEIVIAINSEDVSEIKWTNEGTEVHFTKEDDTWHSADDVDFPVSTEAIEDLLSNFEEVHASFVIEDVEDYSQYGLSDPEHTLTITTSDGDTTITTGTFSKMDEKRYVCINGGNVYLVETDIAENLSTQRDDYLANVNIPYYYQIKEIEISGDTNLSLVFDDEHTHSYTSDYTYFLKDGEEYKPLSAAKVSSLTSKITNTDFTDYVSYKASEDDISEYGFDSPDLTIHINGDLNSDLTEESTGEDSEEAHDLSFVKKDDETVYLHIDDSPIVYNFDPEEYAALAEANYNSLRPTEVVSVNSSELTSITGKVDGTSYNIDVTTDDDGVIVYKIGEEEIEADALITALNNLDIVEFTEDVEYDTLEFSFDISFNNGAVSAQFYRVDGDLCYVIVNDKEVGTLNRDSLMNLKEEFTKVILNLGKEETESE